MPECRGLLKVRFDVQGSKSEHQMVVLKNFFYNSHAPRFLDIKIGESDLSANAEVFSEFFRVADFVGAPDSLCLDHWLTGPQLENRLGLMGEEALVMTTVEARRKARLALMDAR